MRQRRDYRSAEAQRYRSWYKTSRWQRIRTAQLTSQPLCEECKTQGLVTPATVCDHAEPHRGDEARFWAGPFRSLCAPHHDAWKQKVERAGFVIGSDASGRPIDPSHPWNR